MNQNTKKIKSTSELKQAFLDMLDTHKDENDIQRFLEAHTEMIPLPVMDYCGLTGNAIISKFKLGNEFVTDFAYLTGRSYYQTFVLIELEDSRKKIFTGNKRNIHFSKDFNHAVDQITSWKAYVECNKEKILYQIAKLLGKSPSPIIRFMYVLVIGRRSETQNSGYKAAMLAQKNTSDTIIWTYDSVLSNFEHQDISESKLILSPVGDQRFKIKSVPEDISTTIFGWTSPEDIIIEQPQIEQLKQQGYNIDAWLRGKKLLYLDKFINQDDWKDL